MALWSRGGIAVSKADAQHNDGGDISASSPTPQPAAWARPLDDGQNEALVGHDGPAHAAAQESMCHNLGPAEVKIEFAD